MKVIVWRYSVDVVFDDIDVITTGGRCEIPVSADPPEDGFVCLMMYFTSRET